MAGGTADEMQPDLFEDEATRSLLDQLLEDARLYRTSKDYKDLLDFAVRLRNFAPFNAMLLQLQKPGLSYAASARDWRERFGRYPKEDARPLLILWPFGPVALVYDLLDTDGKPTPDGVYSFVAYGSIDATALLGFERLLMKKGIEVRWVDAGDNSAGHIRVVRRAATAKEASHYSVSINRNHNAPVKFSTLAHELGHLALSHLGSDKRLGIPVRPRLTDSELELEAESVAYLVCKRNGVDCKSAKYLSDFVKSDTSVRDLDIYQVMRAAGRVEAMLDLAAQAKFDRPTSQRRRSDGGRI